ncbi:unnamed protein product [Chironomus riparius]|uniref:Uncharacterized protein n=1 Tax=Chironomus riparius TaxID=315576 RepID=A0A9N9WXQ4_9DIPT|nr:unnamed protein product [Chironomus riparius]
MEMSRAGNSGNVFPFPSRVEGFLDCCDLFKAKESISTYSYNKAHVSLQKSTSFEVMPLLQIQLKHKFQLQPIIFQILNAKYGAELED